MPTMPTRGQSGESSLKTEYRLDTLKNPCYNVDIITLQQGGRKEVNEMTGKEIVNLINKLREKKLDDTEIIEIIKYVELTDPKEKEQAQSAESN